MSHSSVIASLESLLVSSEKAVATAEEALSQAKTVLEETQLTLAMILTREKSDQPKADLRIEPVKKKSRKRKPRASEVNEVDVGIKVERFVDHDEVEDVLSDIEIKEENIVFPSDPLDVDSGIQEAVQPAQPGTFRMDKGDPDGVGR